MSAGVLSSHEVCFKNQPSLFRAYGARKAKEETREELDASRKGLSRFHGVKLPYKRGTNLRASLLQQGPRPCFSDGIGAGGSTGVSVQQF